MSFRASFVSRMSSCGFSAIVCSGGICSSSISCCSCVSSAGSSMFSFGSSVISTLFSLEGNCNVLWPWSTEYDNGFTTIPSFAAIV